MTICFMGPENGRKCDEPPPGYQAFKIKLDRRDVTQEVIKTDEAGCALVFVHGLTFHPDRHKEKVLDILRADAIAREQRQPWKR